MIRNDFDPVLSSSYITNSSSLPPVSPSLPIPTLPMPTTAQKSDDFFFQPSLLQQFQLPTAMSSSSFFNPKQMLVTPTLNLNEIQGTNYASSTTSSSPCPSASPCSPQSAFDPPIDITGFFNEDVPHIDAIDEAIGTQQQQQQQVQPKIPKPSCRGGNGMLVWCDVCDLCGKRFFKRGSLIRHIRAAHRSEKRKHAASVPIRLDCPKCPKTFSQQGSLNRHLRSIHESRKLHCQYCDLAFGQAFDLKRHQKRKHPHADPVIPREALPVSKRHIRRR